ENWVARQYNTRPSKLLRIVNVKRTYFSGIFCSTEAAVPGPTRSWSGGLQLDARHPYGGSVGPRCADQNAQQDRATPRFYANKVRPRGGRRLPDRQRRGRTPTAYNRHISSSPRRSRTRSTAIGQGRGTQKLQPDLRPPLSRSSCSAGLCCSCSCARNAPHHHRWVVDEHPIRRNWANIRRTDVRQAGKIAADFHSIFGLRSMAARALHDEDAP